MGCLPVTLKAKAAQVDFSRVKAGDVYSFTRKITDTDLRRFAKLSGDFNPLHMDAAYARKTPFKKKVVHGMLLASFFSRLLGMMCPGEKCLYISQDLKFLKPVFAGQTVTVRAEIKSKNDSIRMITLDTAILVGSSTVVSGEARASFRGE